LIKTQIEHLLKSKDISVHFNSVLINLYRDANDWQGWHSDDEKELGPQPVIGSISFGQKRRFRFRMKADIHKRLEFSLPHGSLLIMLGETQHYWQHEVPKATQKDQRDNGNDIRLNLTYRVIR
jgi:alkylated DNA repair dioxygenase AlkB